MGVPHEYPQTITATTGIVNVVKLNAATRGDIKRLWISERGSTHGGYTFVIYNSLKAFVFPPPPPATQTPPTLAVNANLYRISPVYAVASGTSDGGINDSDTYRSYANLDGSSSNMLQAIYMYIAPTGSGVLTYDISMCIETPNH